MLARVEKDLRERLQGVIQAIVNAKNAINLLEAEKERVRAECSRFSVYFKLLKDWLQVS